MKIDLDFTENELILLQMSVMAFKVNLEQTDPEKISIPALGIESLWEKIQKIR